jgi:hypothetical protein
MNEDLEKAVDLLAEANVLVQKVFRANDALYNLHCMIEEVIATIEDMAENPENEGEVVNV